jgi:hypothetical protein
MSRATFLLVAWLAAQAAGGTDYSINTAGKLFLLGYSARSDGMGGCGALTGDPTNGLLNPAGQAFMGDVGGTVYSNPRPYFQRGYGFLVLNAAAHTEFGFISVNYLNRKGEEDTSYPPEEASVLILAGKPWKNLAVGMGWKILSIRNLTPFTPLNETGSKTYKMAFDVGAAYTGLFPGSTPGKFDEEAQNQRLKFGRLFPRGVTVGIAFQNLGGRVEYDNSTQVEMLPQLFRADLLWGAYQTRWWDLRLACGVEKLLVARNSAGGYKKAGDALFTAWEGGGSEGQWISRFGIEAGIMTLISLRMGWSQEYGTGRFFHHLGFGMGPEWLRANLAWVHEPASAWTWMNGLRMDAAVNVGFDQLRGWLTPDE